MPQLLNNTDPMIEWSLNIITHISAKKYLLIQCRRLLGILNIAMILTFQSVEQYLITGIFSLWILTPNLSSEILIFEMTEFLRPSVQNMLNRVALCKLQVFNCVPCIRNNVFPNCGRYDLDTEIRTELRFRECAQNISPCHADYQWKKTCSQKTAMLLQIKRNASFFSTVKIMNTHFSHRYFIDGYYRVRLVLMSTLCAEYFIYCIYLFEIVISTKVTILFAASKLNYPYNIY